MHDHPQRVRASSSTTWVRAALIGSVAGFGLMCTAHPPPGPVTVPTPAPGNTAAPSSGAAAAGGQTPGKVLCGATQCDLETQVCCFDDEAQSGRCVAKSGAAESDGAASAACGGGTVRECDESADCRGGASCCRDSQVDEQCTISGRWSCSAGGCGSFGALSEEVCVTGGSCASGACAQPPDAPAEAAPEAVAGPAPGFCPASKPGIPCGDKVCALGEGCCWDPAHKTGSCVKDSASCQGASATTAATTRSLYWCLSGADCGAGFECFNTTGSAYYQEYSCGHSPCHPLSAVLGPRLCKTQAECPQMVYAGQEAAPFELTGCEALEGQLPGTKSCTYH